MDNKVLTNEEIDILMKDLTDWQIFNYNEISRVFNFDNFSDAINFVNLLAEIAEEKDHHPSISIDYDKVMVGLTTHTVDGLTEKDFDTAHAIEEAYNK